VSSAAQLLTVLIADDNVTDRLLLSSIVRRQGHAVVTAGDGQEAVDVFRHVGPDLVLLDAMMPVMDGFQAAREIKQLAGADHLPHLPDRRAGPGALSGGGR
jgi:CheY-like chemotaxis protein